MGVKPVKDKQNKDVASGLSKTKTAGQTEKDTIPAKDKSPDDMEIIE